MNSSPKGEKSISEQTEVVGNKNNVMTGRSVDHSVAKHKIAETSFDPQNIYPADPLPPRGEPWKRQRTRGRDKKLEKNSKRYYCESTSW